MTDEMWAEYGQEQRKTIRSWWELGNAACRTITQVYRPDDPHGSWAAWMVNYDES